MKQRLLARNMQKKKKFIHLFHPLKKKLYICIPKFY